jgi:beta-glucosidase
MVEILAGAATLAALTTAAATARLHRRYPELRWDWSGIDPLEARFPEGFLWGAATAAHQVEGGNDNNNWARWETSVDDRGRPRIHNGQRSGAACEHYTRYPDDIRLMAEIGLKTYRFSVEWSRIEPSPGRFDPAAIRHYHDVIDHLLAAGITPMVTLHHFTHPLWFEDLGSFEREENIALFVRFSQRMFAEYGEKVPLWCTHNEPGPFATMGWGLGVFPPGVRSPARLGVVLANLMRSHGRVYAALKSMPGGDAAQIGLVKNIFQFDPWRRWNPAHWVLTRALEEVYNGSILRFLAGEPFTITVPGVMRVREDISERGLDFVGLNYYSHLLLSPLMPTEPPFAVNARPGDVVTDFPYCTYPEGFYRALMDLRGLNKPIYVTENGIPDAKDDRRADFINRYLYAMSRAIQDGCDVRGYYYWSLLDNFEWAEGYDMRFGLFEVDFATQKRRLREGAGAYVAAVKRG